jgi:DNA-binding XRE family transcriptional regulator
MIGAIERGTRNPSLALAKKIANLYNVTVDEILSCLEESSTENI